jgi:PAS domain S-box-containing protein
VHESKATPSLEAEVLELTEPLIVVDALFRIVRVNEAQLRLSGRRREEYLGRTLWDFLDPKTPNAHVFREAYERCMRERVPVDFEAHYAPRALWLAVRVRPLSDGGMVIILRNFTAQRLSELERERLEAQRQLALDVAQMGWWSLDPVARTATFDRRYREIFGVGDGPFDLETMNQMLHPDDLPPVVESLQAALDPRRAVPYHAELRIRRADGVVRWVEVNGRATFEGEGEARQATQLVGTVSDITERVLHQDEMDRALSIAEREQRRLEAVLEALPTGVMITDREGHPQRINAAFHQIWGGAPMAGSRHDTRPWRGFWASNGAPVRDEEWALSRALETGEPQTGDVVEIERFDGSGRATIINAAAPIRDRAGAIVGCVVAEVDISEQRRTELALKDTLLRLETALETTRQAEERLRQGQKMEAVGQLAGGVAHDFNNLLTVILAGTEFLGDGLQPADPLREEVEEIRKAGERAAALVRQLLAFSRKQVLEPRVVDLNELLRGLDGLFKRILGEHLELVLRLEPRLHRCRLDPGQFEQVLVNLVVNARDAMPDGGRITLETANVTLDAEQPELQPGDHVCVTISDTGQGMSPEVQRRVFEPFFTTKQPGRGTGLGLSTVYGIVKQSGGAVSFTSEPGRGTSFRVCFPRVPDGPTEHTPTNTSRVARRGRETVLLVEDEAQVRGAVEGMLTRAGYRVLTAANGEEALRLGALHADEIQLLITDVVMPRMSGHTLADVMRQRRPSLRVLFMSGYDEASVAHGAGDAHFIGKPMSSEALLARVRDVLEA